MQLRFRGTFALLLMIVGAMAWRGDGGGWCGRGGCGHAERHQHHRDKCQYPKNSRNHRRAPRLPYLDTQ
jgi:hypothetical protein